MHFHSQSIGLEGLKLNQIGHFCHDFARKRGLHVTHCGDGCGRWPGSEPLAPLSFFSYGLNPFRDA